MKNAEYTRDDARSQRVVHRLRLPIRAHGAGFAQHRQMLRKAGVVRTDRQSQTVYYSLTPGLVTRVLGVLHEEFCGA